MIFEGKSKCPVDAPIVVCAENKNITVPISLPEYSGTIKNQNTRSDVDEAV